MRVVQLQKAYVKNVSLVTLEMEIMDVLNVLQIVQHVVINQRHVHHVESNNIYIKANVMDVQQIVINVTILHIVPAVKPVTIQKLEYALNVMIAVVIVMMVPMHVTFVHQDIS